MKTPFEDKELFHAYLCEGDERYFKELLNEFNNQNKNQFSDSDIIIREFELFGIDDSRDITRLANLKTLQKQQLFFLRFDSITNQAQDALLKLLEEPPINTHFILVTKYISYLRGTFLSRCRIIYSNFARDYTSDAEKFMQMSFQDRIKYVDKIVKNKNYTKIEQLFESLEVFLSKSVIENKDKLHILYELKKAFKSPGASLKRILHTLATIL